MAPNRYDVIVIGARCRGLADRDAARPRRLPRAARRSGDLSERHALDAPPASSRCRGHGQVGPPRATTRDRLSADRHLHLRLRSRHVVGCAGHSRGAGRVLPATNGARQAPGRRRGLRAVPTFARGSPSRRCSSTATGSSECADTRRVALSAVEHADVVVGADGRFSLLAKTVLPEQYHEKDPILCGYYTYWSGLPVNGRFEVYARPERRLGGRADA